MKRLCCCLLSCTLLFHGCAIKPANTLPQEYVLIDAGHGGFDGGAVATDGSCEKDYNLSISLILRDILKVCGISVVMTRETDTALAPKKSEDMRQRLALYEGAQSVISIHQNQFPIPRYNGTQTFYSSQNVKSKALAEAIQSAVTQHIQPDNHRPVKAVENGVFLFNNTTASAALVECGFLSNETELQKLKTPEYQQQLSFAITLGYFTYLIQK